MKRGNYKTRKAWKQDICRKSHSTAPIGYGHVRIRVPQVQPTIAAAVFGMVASMFRMQSRKGNR